jgi:hypothetical protein
MSSNEPQVPLSKPNAASLHENSTSEQPPDTLGSLNVKMTEQASNRDKVAEKETTDDDGDQNMSEDVQEEREQEFVSLGQLEAMYHHAVPRRKKDTLDKEREAEVNETIKAKIREDFVKYKIGEPPQEVGAGLTDTVVIEGRRLDWKKNKLRLAKGKVLYGYGLKDQQYDVDDSTLDELLEGIRENEDDWGLDDEIQRESSMSDEEWSKTKSDFLEKARSDPAKREQIEQQKAKEAEDDAADAIAQKDRQQEAAHAADPGRIWQATEKTVIVIRQDSRPKGLPELQKVMASLILHWWENPPTSSDMQTCTGINASINYLPDGSAWKIVPTEIELWQNKLRESLTICERDSGDPKFESELENLARCAITLTNRLRKSGLDWKMVLSRDTHRRIFTCLQRSTSASTKAYTDELANAYFAVRKQQVDLLAPIVSLILPFMYSDGKILKENFPLCTEQIKSLNSKLGELNLSLALPREDHIIPITDLEDVVEHYRCNRSTEAEGGIAKMLYKVKLLQLPGFEAMSAAHGNADFDKSQAYNEALDIARPAKLLRDYDDAPLLNVSGFTHAYEGTVMKTVGWGMIKRRKFYINQYGLSSAPIWRLERNMSKEWQTAHGGADPPFRFKVTASVNRFGDEINRTTDLKRWGSQNIVGIFGVAFEQGPPEDPLLRLHPDTYETGVAGRWDNQYVLVGWDFDGNGINVERRWETRSCLRERWGKAEADKTIYDAAKASQENFDRARGSTMEFRNVSLRPKEGKTKGSRYPLPKTSDRLDESSTYRFVEDLDGNEASQSHGTANKKNAAKDRPKTRSSTKAARTEDVKRDLEKMSEDDTLSEKAVAAIMIARYGVDWTKCFL